MSSPEFTAEEVERLQIEAVLRGDKRPDVGQVLESRDTLETLRQIPPSQLSEGCFCFVLEEEEIYLFVAESRAAVQPPGVIATCWGSNCEGRWICIARDAKVLQLCPSADGTVLPEK